MENIKAVIESAFSCFQWQVPYINCSMWQVEISLAIGAICVHFLHKIFEGDE